MLAGFDPYRETTSTSTDLITGQELTHTYHYDPALGQRVLDFGERHLVHALGKWQSKPLILSDWQQSLILNLFGWVDQWGNRRFRELFLTCARKAGKSTLCTLLAWWFAACEPMPAPSITLVANSIKQANDSLWRTILWQRNHNSKLEQRWRHYKTQYRMLDDRRNGVLCLLPASGKTSHGGSNTLVIFDELSWSTNNDLYVGLSSGMGARDNALSVTCSTVSHITDNIFYDQLQHARKVRDGVESDPRLLPVIYELPQDEDWRDKTRWFKANPNLHLGLPNDLETEYQKAIKLPSYEAEFRMTKLNQVVGAANLWLPVHTFDDHQHTWPQELEQRPCVLGLDLSTSQDITSWVATWMVDDWLYIDPYYFIPLDNIHERVRVHKVRYDLWKDDPLTNLTCTPGNVIDYQEVEKSIIKFAQSHHVEALYFDRHKWCSVVLGVAGTGLECAAVNQDYASMNGPCHEFERLFLAGRVTIKNKNPIYRWMLSHTEVKTNMGGEIRVNKPEHKNHKKVDAITATLNTLMHHIRLKEKVIDWDMSI